jgi:lipopolysaccharide transport system permease protein
VSATSQVATGPRPGYRIASSRRRFRPNLLELWKYRELMYFLVWRDVKLRYQQTLLGVGWALIQPLVAMFVFTIIFGSAGSSPSTASRIRCS